MEIKDKREKEEVPSGIRLMLLLKERLVEIMDRERANQNSIHLYCTGPYWVAFECSAYQLYRAFPDSETTPLRLFAYPFPIVMVSVQQYSVTSNKARDCPAFITGSMLRIVESKRSNSSDSPKSR